MATINSDSEALLSAIRKAAAAVTRAEQALTDRRAELTEAIAAGAKGRIKPAALVQASGKSAETVRQISREHGVERLRPPTNKSFTKVDEGESADS